MSALIEPTAYRVRSQGVSLTYWDYGNPSAPTVVLIHGSRDHARSWDWAASRLAADFHVVAVDLRGHGDSDWSADGAYAPNFHVQDFLALADALDADPLHIVGHSFGANIAGRYAALFPDRVAKLVFVDGFGPLPEAYERWAASGPIERTRGWLQRRLKARGAPRRFTLEEGIERIALNNPRLEPEQARHIAIHAMRAEEGAYRWKLDPQVGIFTTEDLAVRVEETWKYLHASTLLLFGDQSWNAETARDGRTDAIADLKVVEVPDAGHWLHHDQLEMFVGEVRDFLRD